jgi:mannan endo-1,4-beta-mannosidase
MKFYSYSAVFFAAMILPISAASSLLQNYITARDGKLFDGTNEFRFISFDVPNLLMIEDNVAFTNENPWRLPDKFEINDALETVSQMGGTVARTYVITVARTNDLPGTPRHVLGPGKFDESAFRTLDEVLATANRTGVRLIIPLVDNWVWQGGRADYARWRGKTKDDFWTDPQIISDFQQTIHYILTRTNSVTGVRYCDDKAVLCWETGNEIQSPVSWTREIAHYIKSLDTNHLVMDGFYATVLRDASLEMPDVDIVTTHHYPSSRSLKTFSELISENAARSRGKKPYIVGEFGFVDTEQMIETMKTISDSGMSGGMLWSLRFRNRDGGFYWHSEPDGANVYKAFHWPPSEMGVPYDEEHLMNAVRENAFAIRGIPAPEVPIPVPPKLLPIGDASAISWQGSVGATSYQIERAAKCDGDWRIISSNVDEAFTQYRPQFADENAPAGNWYYRVRAKNDSGLSMPSNVESVAVTNDTLVDEMSDFSKINSQQGGWMTSTRDCRPAKEDAHRAVGEAGDFLIYSLPTEIKGFRIFTFFPEAESDLRFSTSNDGKHFQEITAQREIYYNGAGEYGYWKPIIFYAEKASGGKFLKIELTGVTQISRVEISHKALPQ